MHYTDVIRRAFRITWTHKSLWLLGFLASLGSGGSGGDNRGAGNQMPGWMDSGVQRWLEGNAGLLIGVVGGGCMFSSCCGSFSWCSVKLVRAA